ncbi:hypothetical protein QQS21_003339 [Conoideocrella luteorostrata]|uniref:Uncharacterized protein n=1 Tax=Conoideocrella luteorostrata TaxID=1105319 RepID=A0AAJ0G2C7_9HYPO|nr:hypothetical protein QQS21_003339 [Conoideocrella luteorostrata]
MGCYEIGAECNFIRYQFRSAWRRNRHRGDGTKGVATQTSANTSFSRSGPRFAGNNGQPVEVIEHEEPQPSIQEEESPGITQPSNTSSPTAPIIAQTPQVHFNSYSNQFPNDSVQSTGTRNWDAFPRLTRREASLMRIYILSLATSVSTEALWSEMLADEACPHFAVEVPKLALEKPMLLYGILAVASRYEAVACNPGVPLESTYYHSKCIELIIQALDSQEYDATILTAVVLSRLYEEIDNDDDRDFRHLRGTKDLLCSETIKQLASQGGLAEAASWVHLRQAIYVSIIRREPIQIPLDTFKIFTAFRHDDETSHANRIVYIFSRILNAYFGQSKCSASERWSGSEPRYDEYSERNAMGEDVEEWHRSKPKSFDPLYHDLDETGDCDEPPCITMMSTVAGR